MHVLGAGSLFVFILRVIFPVTAYLSGCLVRYHFFYQHANIP